MAALDNIASELLKAANVADLNFKKTRDQAERDKAVRLRRIVENLKAISAGGLTPTLDQVLTEGNTSTNTLNVGGITTDYVQLDTAATPTLAPGMFGWNDAYGTADLRLKGNNVTLQLGQETLARVVNKTGSDLLESEYKVVRVRIASEGGAQGQRLAVVLAQGLNDPDSATTLGIVTETIPNNQEGFITVFGNVNNINTTGSLQGETWADGDVLYLSPTIAGGLTKVKPIAPQHMVVMGYVVYAHAINGKIFVKVDNGYELDELHNVLITSPANNDLLQYNSAQQVWKNVAPSIAVPTPTLAQVTAAGNTTTNGIVLGSATAITVSPYTLQVVGGAGGSAIFSNSAKTQGLNINLTTAGETRIYGDYFGAGVDQKLILGTFANRATQLVLQTSGNVGIGTTTDSGYKLDVNGTARINSSLYVTDPSYTGAGRLYQAANSTLVLTGGPGGGSENITFGPSNRIFINAGQTRFPGGSVQMASTLTLGNSGNATSTNMLLMQGSITAGSALGRGIGMDTTLVAAANNDVLVGLDINPTFTNGAFTGVTNTALRVTGNTTLNGNINITSNNGSIINQNSYASNIFTVKAVTNTTDIGGMIINSGTGDCRFGSFRVGGGYYTTFYVNNAEIIRLSTSNNVLIGTTTDAGYKLDVNGTARVQGVITGSVGGGAITLGAAAANQSAISINGYFTGNGAIITSNANGRSFNSIIGAQNSGIISSYNGNAQGQTIANHYFLATGNINLTDGAIDLNAFAFTPTIVSETGATIKAFSSTLSAASNHYNLYLSGTAQNYLAGNVGIGLNNPQGATHIAVASGTPALVLSDVGSPNTIPTLQFRRGPLSAFSLQVDFPSNIKARFQIGDAVTGYEFTGGNVGLTGGRAIEFGGITGQVATAIIGSVHTDNNNGQLLFSTRGSAVTAERARITNNGNFLINTTTDAGYKLDVNGTGRFSGQVKFDNSNIIATGITSQVANFQIARANTNTSVEIIGGATSVKFDATSASASTQFAGKVAIGSAYFTPTEMLHVDGSIKSSALTLNGPVLATGGVLSSIAGYTGLFTVPTNPPGMQTLDIQNGIIVNIL